MQNNFLLIFLAGLTTGGLTCLAIQGGLLASLSSNQKSSFQPTIIFLTTKIILHTLFGFLLGLIGTSIKLTPIFQGYFQIILGFYLFGIAGNLLNLHPFFRYFVFTPPKFILKFARKLSQNNSNQKMPVTIYELLNPAILGGLTIFLPCATTQAVEVLALTTHNPLRSALLMFFFTLGTTPTFLIFSSLLHQGQNRFQRYFPKILGAFLIFMSVYTANSGISLTGSVYTVQNFYRVATKQNQSTNSAVLGTSSQIATISVSNSGYTPQNITLKKGVPVKLNLITDHVENCSRSFTIPSLNIQKLLPETGSSTIEFTPKETGLLAFACSMGMYTGNFNVVN